MSRSSGGGGGEEEEVGGGGEELCVYTQFKVVEVEGKVVWEKWGGVFRHVDNLVRLCVCVSE